MTPIGKQRPSQQPQERVWFLLSNFFSLGIGILKSYHCFTLM